MNDWAMVGIGDSTPEIETGVLAGGTAAATLEHIRYRPQYRTTYHVPLWS